MTVITLSESLLSYQRRIETVLDGLLPAADVLPEYLHAAMRYSVLGSGKRIRPLFVYASGAAFAVPTHVLDAPAAAVELIHAYSLVHDDLPAMDDDLLRRGKPSCHAAYDEATAILAGDALQALAFQTIAAADCPDMPAAQRLGMLERLAAAAGSKGMAGGQAIDLNGVGSQPSEAELETMHLHKTGALIRCSVLLGAMSSAHLADSQLQQLDQFAWNLGLAFQVQDDILDVEGNAELLGKVAGADAAADKPTYPSVIGLDASKRKLQKLYEDALDALQSLQTENTDLLLELARFTVNRVH